MAKQSRAKRATVRAKPGRRQSKPGVRPGKSQSRSTKVQALLHELQVHAEEITVQNEQLLKAQAELEDARDRFADLYDFAPIGYLSLNDHGIITEVNIAGATLLGRDRAFLINLPLSSMIAKEQREELHQFVSRALDSKAPRQRSVELTVRSNGRRLLRFIARPGVVSRRGQLLTAMVDVTEERRIEGERHEALVREQAHAHKLASEVSERTAAEQRVKALLERLVTAQEDERLRIARNLHDHLGQQMTALRLTLDTIIHDDATPPPLRERIAVVDEIVAALDRDVDLLAWDLRPATLDDNGLTAALAELVRQWSTITDVPAEFHQSTPDQLFLPDDVESNLYRIVQEALNNVAKHARATHASVLIEQRRDEIAVIVEDNGRGFDVEAVAAKVRQSRMGILSIRERAALIDGQVQIESKPGQGTTIFIRVPVKARL